MANIVCYIFTVMWRGFIPSSVVAVLNADRLLVFIFSAKISKTLIVMLHKLWLSRHSLIHNKQPCEVAIEELNDAREDIEEIVESVDCLQLIRVRKMQLPLDIKSMMAPRIKGWLFTYYSLTEEIESGDHMNDRTLMHQN